MIPTKKNLVQCTVVEKICTLLITKGRMLAERDHQILDRHFGGRSPSELKDGERVVQWEGMESIYNSGTGRIWLSSTSVPKKHTPQQFYFHCVNSTAGTLTRAHKVKLWDRRRLLTPRETARLFGYPEDFSLPARQYNRLFGNSVAIPCVRYALSLVLDGSERTHVDMCSGIGGFSVAASSFGLKCVGFSEIFRPAIECYLTNFPGTPAIGDAKNVESVPRCDLLTAGFPCQPFSNANSITSLDKHDNIDFYKTIVEAIRKSECTKIVLENVSNFLTVGRERWYDLKRSLTDLGFHVEACVLDASDFGVPQKRKRVFIVGKRGTPPLPFDPPSLPSDRKAKILDIPFAQ
jgi:site-specific DNA-cytosine methylase